MHLLHFPLTPKYDRSKKTMTILLQFKHLILYPIFTFDRKYPIVSYIANFLPKLLTILLVLFVINYIMSSETPKKPANRLTIVIDDTMEEKLRDLQGNLISSERKNFSLSKIVNMVLVAGFMASNKLNSAEWTTIRSIVYGKKVIISELPTKEYVVNLAAMAELV